MAEGSISGINIASAPVKYQPGFNKADEKGNKNGIVDAPAEAQAAATDFCSTSPAQECIGLLEFLEKSASYSFPEIRERAMSEKVMFENIAEETGHKKEALQVLAKFKEKGIIEKYGIEVVKNLLFEIAKGSCVKMTRALKKAIKEGAIVRRDTTPIVYKKLIELCEKKVIEKIGVLNLTEITTASSDYINSAYEALIKLDKEGLIKKIGPLNLVKIAKAAGPNSSLAFWSLISLAEFGLIEKIGPSNLVKMAKSAGSETFCSYNVFVDLIQKSGGYPNYSGSYTSQTLINKIGLMNLVEIAIATGSDSYSAYKALVQLNEKGLIDKIGMQKLVEIARKAKEHTAEEYEKLLNQ